MAEYAVAELAAHVRGHVEGDEARRISGVAPVEHAGRHDLTFVVNEHYGRVLVDATPGAVLVPEELSIPPGEFTVIRVTDPQAAFARLVRLFRPEERRRDGIAPSAIVEPGAHLGDDVYLGPYVVVEGSVEIGRGTRVGAHTVIERGAKIGEDCDVATSCTILGSVRMGDRVRLLTGVRVGTDGYGYTENAGAAVRFPQVGGCVIGDDVEIGANSTVDRGALGDTVIGARTKIDNLVHIGHNVRVGQDCMIVAQVGIAGSVEVGREVQIGGQAGLAGHLAIGDGARIGAQAGVIGDVPAGGTFSGYPARPHGRAMRASAALFRLPELVRRMRRIEERLREEEDEHDGERAG